MLRLLLAVSLAAWAQETPGQRAVRYCAALVKIDTTNPPGNETPAAEYIQAELRKEGFEAELLGGDRSRLNAVSRIRGSGAKRPLLLMAHTDVVPADRSPWTVDPFAALVKDGFLYGRGSQDDKCLLAAEMSVFVELKRRGVKLDRDVILLGEADEEAGSIGIQWMVANAFWKIEAEFGINEGGTAVDSGDTRVFQIQTSEKIPTRVRLMGKGTAGHGSLPRGDNPVVHLARAIAKLADADQPVELNTTTRRFMSEMSKLPDYAWLSPFLPQLEKPNSALTAANRIRQRDPELSAILRTTVSPTMLDAGVKINVIPNAAGAQVDVRRLPTETREQVIERFRKIIGDPAVEVQSAGGQDMPATEPSSLTTELYIAIQEVLKTSHPKSVITPFMSRGATDSSYLRQKGMALYGAPVLLRTDKEGRAHGNDERMPLKSIEDGTDLLLKIVTRVAASPRQ
ncbi:MAG: M20/M25/M40 family metallo-hydrolase [Bryobacteraceae bacterium]